MTQSFVPYSDTAAAQDQAESNSAASGGSGSFYEIKDGANILRILPSVDPKNPSPFRIRWRHWVNLPGGGSVKFNCPNKMGGGTCSICDKANSLKASPDQAVRDKGFKMSPTRRAMFIAVDRNDEEKGPQICDFPAKSVYDPIVALRTNSRNGSDFTDPKDGFDIVITRTKGARTSYSVMPDRQNSALGTPEQATEWVSAVPSIDHMMRVPTNDEVREMFQKAMHGVAGDTTTRPAPAVAPRAGVSAEDRIEAQAQSTVEPTVADDDIPF